MLKPFHIAAEFTSLEILGVPATTMSLLMLRTDVTSHFVQQTRFKQAEDTRDINCTYFKFTIFSTTARLGQPRVHEWWKATQLSTTSQSSYSCLLGLG